MRLGLPLNDNLGLSILGNFFVARVEWVELASITDEDIELLKQMQFAHQLYLLEMNNFDLF